MLDPDVLRALQILKGQKMRDEIFRIGCDPFNVHYCTKHQQTMYRAIADKEYVSLSIDATGSLFNRVKRPGQTLSGPIFLYHAIARTTTGQVSLGQMLSERHNTLAIYFWMIDWIEGLGLPPPKEIITDASRAILAASIRAFTKYQTIVEYADSFCPSSDTNINSSTPPCYIRIDVAHYMKIWAVFFKQRKKQIRSEVAQFYKTTIGKLILCRDITKAAQIVHAILLISRSPYDGQKADESLSACERQKKVMDHILTGSTYEELGIEENDDNSNGTGIENMTEENDCGTSVTQSSEWYKWAKSIESSCLQEIQTSPGTKINPHWQTDFADKLMQELKMLPLWSCIFQSSFGYGRCPPSSAPAEAEFNILKTYVLKEIKLPTRPDIFMAVHKDYLDGKLKLFDAHIPVNSIPSSVIQSGDIMGSTHLNESAELIDPIDTSLQARKIHESTTEDSCPVCANGDFPEENSAHKCQVN